MDMLVDRKDAAGSFARPDIKSLLFGANISINGTISDATLTHFLEHLSEVRNAGDDVIMELNTTGGDADVARRIALEIRLFARLRIPL